jgi:hypothetical protein
MKGENSRGEGLGDFPDSCEHSPTNCIPLNDLIAHDGSEMEAKLLIAFLKDTRNIEQRMIVSPQQAKPTYLSK